MSVFILFERLRSARFITGQSRWFDRSSDKTASVEIHAGAASVQQDAGHSEFSCGGRLMEFCQIILRQLTQAVGQKDNVGILKAGAQELDRLIQGLF